MLGTPPKDKLHKHLHIFNACEHSWIMVGSKMSKTEYDLKAIMYPVYDTPHKLFYEMPVFQNIQCKQKAYYMKPKRDSKLYISGSP